MFDPVCILFLETWVSRWYCEDCVSGWSTRDKVLQWSIESEGQRWQCDHWQTLLDHEMPLLGAFNRWRIFYYYTLLPNFYPADLHSTYTRVENGVDPDQMVSLEASWSGSKVFQKRYFQVQRTRVMPYTEKVIWSGSTNRKYKGSAGQGLTCFSSKNGDSFLTSNKITCGLCC